MSETEFSEIIEKQMLMKPDYLIGLEDLTIPALMMAHLTHECYDPDPKEVLPFQQKTVQLFKEQCKWEYWFKSELDKTLNFLVVHAYDYQTAYQGAEQILPNSDQGIAISYGGPMRSRRYITSLKIGTQTEHFDEKLPESYLIAQAITLGAINGSTTQMPVHILGVGTPILIALISSLLRRSPAISIDSTAPFKEANAETIYGSK